jgi:hypothetical protein
VETSTQSLPATSVVADVRLWRMLDAEKQRIEAQLKEVTGRLVRDVGPGRFVLVDGKRTAIAQQQQREVPIDQLQAVVSRRLFGTLTKRSINWGKWDALASLGKLPMEAERLLTRKPKAAYVVDGGKA